MWVGVVQVVDQGKLVEAQAVEPVVYNPDALWVEHCGHDVYLTSVTLVTLVSHS